MLYPVDLVNDRSYCTWEHSVMQDPMMINSTQYLNSENVLFNQLYRFLIYPLIFIQQHKRFLFSSPSQQSIQTCPIFTFLYSSTPRA